MIVVDESRDRSSEEPFAVGTRVTSDRRGKLIGIVKSDPFLTNSATDCRRLVWVDYRASGGPVALEQIRGLRLMKVRD